jgi:AraC family transcriptional regulator, L-rhamnose operon transcriptional activator RhaR
MLEYKARDHIDLHENINLYKYVPAGEEKEHTHDFIEIEYIYCGSGYQVVNGITHYVERGDLLFFNFGDRHSFQPQVGMGILNCLINPEFISTELVSSENALDILALTAFNEFRGGIDRLLPKIRFSGKELLEVEAVLEFMLQEFFEKSPGYVTALKGYCNVLLTKIFRTVKRADPINMYSEIGRIAPKILKFIEENYHKKLTLKQLSSESFYNPTYFSTLFKEYAGKTLTEYIIEKRIHAAIQLMKETSYSIEHISQQVGYNDKKQFYKQFKAYAGITPKQYRDKT